MDLEDSSSEGNILPSSKTQDELFLNYKQPQKKSIHFLVLRIRCYSTKATKIIYL